MLSLEDKRLSRIIKMEKIQVDVENWTKSSEIHLLPCKISYDGMANVKSFFSSSILNSENADSEVLESSLRGRPLHGVKINLEDKIGNL